MLINYMIVRIHREDGLVDANTGESPFSNKLYWTSTTMPNYQPVLYGSKHLAEFYLRMVMSKENDPAYDYHIIRVEIAVTI